jgi:hypothetical protein
MRTMPRAQGTGDRGQDSPTLTPTLSQAWEREKGRLVRRTFVFLPGTFLYPVTGVLLLFAFAAFAAPPKSQKPHAQRPTPNASTFWSFSPVVRPAVPKVKRQAWVTNPMDAFLLAKMEAKGFAPAPEADRRTLLRRVTFDLTGLPPTLEDVQAFLEDKSPDAWAKVVDRLLNSPQYGERWGRHWLDLVRYTDSLDKRDTDTIRDINDAWRYRDWVVNALNRDIPYDEFLRQQIAGDLLPGDIPNDINKSGTIATGLLAIGNWGNGDGDKLKTLANIADDQIDVVSRSVMGLTVACARCHDHKFDPISTKDYYALAGIFYSTRILPRLQPNDAMELPLKIPLLTQSEKKQRAEWAANLANAEQNFAQISAKPLQEFARRSLSKTADYVYATWAFRNRPEAQAGVSLAQFAESQGLEPTLLRQWRDYFAAGDFRRLDVPVRDWGEVSSVHVWKGRGETPFVMCNTNPVARRFGSLEIPRIATAVHPGNKGVVISWQSPITGKVAVGGGVKDADTAGGNGIGWMLDWRTASGAQAIATGEMAAGGEEYFRSEQGGQITLNVKRGDRVQLLITPQENADHDGTLVLFRIADARGQKWDLTGDIVEDVLMNGKGNPHPDAQGNADVWHFEELADSHRLDADEMTEDARARWRQTASLVGMEHAAQVKQAAAQFARTFRVTDAASPFWLHEREAWKGLPSHDRLAVMEAAERVDTLKASAPPPIEYANGIQDGGVPNGAYAGFRDARIHKRGNPQALSATVPRGFPAVLSDKTAPRITKGSGRLELARWITHPKHPLTARVIVNRLWQHHFGEGLVRTPSNFGLLGERPTHPELLDWLASELVRQRWSLKAMHRLMLLSSAYRQSSRVPPKVAQSDPENRWFARQSRRRLEAEAVRDSLLFVAGTLDSSRGGKAINDANTKRRALYLMAIRSGDDPFRAVFDGADPSVCVEKRVETTVAPQALYLLNNQFVLERAQELAARVTKSTPDETERIRRLYALLFARTPTPAEEQVAHDFLHPSGVQTDATQAWRDYAHLLLCANEFVLVD